MPQAVQPTPAAAPQARRRTILRRRLTAVVAVVALVVIAGEIIGPGAPPAGPYTARVSWPAAPGAQQTTIVVDGTLVDSIAGAAGTSYVLHELWPDTAFSVTVRQYGAEGRLLATSGQTVHTTPADGPFPRLYSPSSFINQPIGRDPPVDPASAAIVATAILPYTGLSNLADAPRWGIPVVTADPQSPLYEVGCRLYWCNVRFPPVRIPAGARPSTGSDGHLVVLQPDGQEMDMWVAQHSGSTWTAGERWMESASGPAANCATEHACGGANAADFALAAGLVRPEEIAQGHIDHALAITTPDTRQGYIACPATNGDGKHTDPDALPIGAHVQLDPSINVAALNIPAWQKVIATALQTYGAYVVDTGGSIGIYAESNLGRTYNAWAKAGVPDTSPSLSDLPWNDLRVLSMTQCGS